MPLGACIDVCAEHSNLLNAPGTLSTAGSSVSNNQRVERPLLPQAQTQATVTNDHMVSSSVTQADVPEIILQPPSAPETDEEDSCAKTEAKGEISNKIVVEPSSMQGESLEDHRVKIDKKNGNLEETETRLIIESGGEEKEGSGNDEQEELPPLPDAPPVCLNGEDEDEDFPAPPPDPDEDLISFGETETKQNGGQKESQQKEEKESDALETETQNDGGCEVVWTMRQSTHEAPLRVGPRKPPLRSPSSVSAQSAPVNFATSMECECEQLERLEPVLDNTSKSSLFYNPPANTSIVRPAPIVITANRNGPVQSAIAVTRPVSNSGVANSNDQQNNCAGPVFSETKPLQNSEILPNVDKTYNLNLTGGSMRQRPNSAVNMEHSSRENDYKDAPALVPPVMRQRATSEGRVGPMSSAHPDALFHEPSAFKRHRPHEPHPNHNHFSATLPRSTKDDSVWVPLAQRFQLDNEVGSFSEPEEPFQRQRPRPRTVQNNVEVSPPKFRTYTPQPKPSRKFSGDDLMKGNETCV